MASSAKTDYDLGLEALQNIHLVFTTCNLDFTNIENGNKKCV